MGQKSFTRAEGRTFVTEALPDGSAVIFDTSSEVMHSLNATARIVWDACAEPVTVADVAEVLRRRTTGVTDATAAAEDALAQLIGFGLVVAQDLAEPVPASLASPSRRSALLVAVGAPVVAFATPLVLSMALGEQQAQAFAAQSPLPTPTTGPTPTSSPTPTTGPTGTPTVTPTPTNTPTPTVTPTPTDAPTPTVTPTPTDMPTPTPTPTPTNPPTPTPTPPV